ncbi:MAG: 6,7-dimethyl-8-ribityllumazine synthase [bacterium]|nr:6,7-dimethyl-8-ribityllumazine synthase [bacterium]
MRIKEKNKFKKIVFSPQVKVGVVVARFNQIITDQILEQALEALSDCKIKKQNILVVSVPGSMEIPVALLRLAKTKKFDCLLAIGCVMRGETKHFDYVCKMAQEGILKVALDNNIPIGFGILTVNNLKQALARVGIGKDAVLAAVELSKI